MTTESVGSPSPGARRWRGFCALALLAALPFLAYAPALGQGKLLGSGDGTFLHFPLRAAVWEAYRQGELPSWNPAIFSGTGLLAAYRPGALYLPALFLAPFTPFVAFQILILVSLSATAVLSYVYARRLGAEEHGAYFAGLAFALGPYLVNHLGDSATVIAAPWLLASLIATEAYVSRMTPGRAFALALSTAFLCLAGSPEALRAGLAVVAGRLLLAHVVSRNDESLGRTLLPLVAGCFLAAPQLLPSLLAVRDAGRQVVGFADIASPGPSGAAGQILRYVSHTPAPALVAASLPLALRSGPVRILGTCLGLCLVLQWGRGPLTDPSAVGLILDLAMSLLAGLSLSAQWQSRSAPEGSKLRTYFIGAALASAAVLPVSAATAGPLAPNLAAGVGLLALAVIVYFSLATARRAVVAGLWLAPLTISFLLQPNGRGILADSPTRPDLLGESATRSALDRLMGTGRDERILTLSRRWPPEALDLAFGNLAVTARVRSANGYDPMLSLRSRSQFEGLNAGGILSAGSFFRSDCSSLAVMGLRWAQVPTSALTSTVDSSGFGEAFDMTLVTGERRTFPFPVVPATEVRVVSSLSDGVSVPQGEAVARLIVHLASGRHFTLALRAGEETAEWAYDRADVRPVVRHGRPRVFESWPMPEAGFEGHRYLASLKLPGRYLVSGISVEAEAPRARLAISRLAFFDESTRSSTPASLVAAFVSDTRCFVETARTPAVRLFELPQSPGRARVVGELRVLPDAVAVRRALQAPLAAGFDLGRVALADRQEVQDVALPPQARSAQAEIEQAQGNTLRVSASGPGLLVVAENWDPGWAAWVDGRPTRVIPVNQAQMGIVLSEGPHRVTLRHRPRGLSAGLVLAVAALLGLALPLVGRRRVRAR